MIEINELGQIKMTMDDYAELLKEEYKKGYKEGYKDGIIETNYFCYDVERAIYSIK